LNLQDQVQALDVLAASLSKATSIRDKVKLADRIFEALGACERLVERFIVTELAGTSGTRSLAQAEPIRTTDELTQSKRFRDLTLAEVGRLLLKERGLLHGKEIEKLAREGGYKSGGEHFQSYLATAFKREGDFENIGKNRWKLKDVKENPAE
jgi:hypothetical protein